VTLRPLRSMNEKSGSVPKTCKASRPGSPWFQSSNRRSCQTHMAVPRMPAKTRASMPEPNMRLGEIVAFMSRQGFRARPNLTQTFQSYRRARGGRRGRRDIRWGSRNNRSSESERIFPACPKKRLIVSGSAISAISAVKNPGSEKPAINQQSCSHQEQQPGGGSDVNLLHDGAPSLSAGGKGGPSGSQSQSTVTRCSTARNSGSSVTITASIRIAVATAKASA